MSEFAGADDRSGSPIEVRAPRLVLNGVGKTFGSVRALRGVSMTVLPGEVKAIVGENGAGKSTMMKIIAGVENPDGGEALYEGQSIDDIDEGQAASLGIAMVHQERSLVPHLSVAENIFAARQPTRGGLIDWRSMHQRSGELLARLRVDISPDALVGSISPAEQQMVEIAKALSHDLRLLILDEPTAALTITESERLFEIVRSLRDDGVSVLYISHRLAEVFEIADSILVLRDGEVMAEQPASSLTESQLMTLMVGRELSFERVQHTEGHVTGEIRLSVRGLSAPPRVTHADVEVRAGEIVCLAGLIGAGRTELCEAIFGLNHNVDGTIEIDGQPVRITSPNRAMSLGVGMIPEDRKDAGLFLEMSVALNIAATNLHHVSRRGWISSARIDQLAKTFVERLRVRTPGVDQRVDHLSGGNQQKVLLAKWIARNPGVLIIDEPTRGVDVGARTEIYEVIRELAANGTAVLMVSSDLIEVLSLSDRIVVMAEGHTTGHIAGHGATELAVLELAAPKSDYHQEIAR